jgi:putative Holliday junction resolvase
MRALPRVETLVLPPRARLIGVDLGSKTIGLALSDVERSLASPLMTIKRTQFVADAQALADKAREFEAAALVFGNPLALDGGDSPRAQATRAFAREFTKRHPMPLVFWDERMSTAAVERDLIAQNVSLISPAFLFCSKQPLALRSANAQSCRQRMESVR